jgi:hypothetical protein
VQQHFHQRTGVDLVILLERPSCPIMPHVRPPRFDAGQSRPRATELV